VCCAACHGVPPDVSPWPLRLLRTIGVDGWAGYERDGRGAAPITSSGAHRRAHRAPLTPARDPSQLRLRIAARRLYAGAKLEGDAQADIMNRRRQPGGMDGGSGGAAGNDAGGAADAGTGAHPAWRAEIQAVHRRHVRQAARSAPRRRFGPESRRIRAPVTGGAAALGGRGDRPRGALRWSRWPSRFVCGRAPAAVSDTCRAPVSSTVES